ncbi:hypothetical protein [Cedecea neteri]|uniref:hypothetical protein n=1 Tax=Cedecea neteri TaxID=158822 RepID=UPI00057E14C6|nr:hypothetical protein [Cedecea neteri]
MITEQKIKEVFKGFVGLIVIAIITVIYQGYQWSGISFLEIIALFLTALSCGMISMCLTPFTKGLAGKFNLDSSLMRRGLSFGYFVLVYAVTGILLQFVFGFDIKMVVLLPCFYAAWIHADHFYKLSSQNS